MTVIWPYDLRGIEINKKTRPQPRPSPFSAQELSLGNGEEETAFYFECLEERIIRWEQPYPFCDEDKDES